MRGGGGLEWRGRGCPKLAYKFVFCLQEVSWNGNGRQCVNEMKEEVYMEVYLYLISQHMTVKNKNCHLKAE